MTHAAMAPRRAAAAGITDGLLRLSVGIEHVDLLADDRRPGWRAHAAGQRLPKRQVSA